MVIEEGSKIRTDAQDFELEIRILTCECIESRSHGSRIMNQINQEEHEHTKNFLSP